MSQENVALAYRAADALNRRDLDAFLAFVDPKVEFRPLDVELEGGGPYRGHDGFRRWFQNEIGVFPDISGEIEEIRDLGDLTLALVRVRGRGMESDVPTEGMSWQVTEWRHGKVIWFRDFRSEAEAVEVVRQRGSAMSQESLEGLRRGLDSFNRRDKAAFLELCDPALENIPPRDWPESEPIRGRETVWEFFVQGFEPWELSPLRLVEMVDAGNDRVVALVQGEMQGKASGAVVPWSYWLMVTARDGKVVRFEWFADQAEALEAAGLSE